MVARNIIWKKFYKRLGWVLYEAILKLHEMELLIMAVFSKLEGNTVRHFIKCAVEHFFHTKNVNTSKFVWHG